MEAPYKCIFPCIIDISYLIAVQNGKAYLYAWSIIRIATFPTIIIHLCVGFKKLSSHEEA